MISHGELFPDPPKAAVPGAHHSVQLQELHFHHLCVCEVFDSASTDHGSCPVLPARMSKISQRAEVHPRLNLDGSVTNYRLECEIRVASPWAVLGAGWALEPGCRGADRCRHESQGPACCFQPLASMCFTNLKFLHVAIGKGRTYFAQ